MRSRRNLSLSESESESATKRRRAPVLGRFAGRAEAAEGVAGRFAGDAADDTGASDGPRVAGFRSRGDAARRVWGVGDAARTTGVGLGARTTGVGLGARTGLERGPGASSPPPACKVPFVGCTDGTPLPPRASSFCWHVSRIRVAFFSCSMHALRGQKQRAKRSCGKGPAGLGGEAEHAGERHQLPVHSTVLCRRREEAREAVSRLLERTARGGRVRLALHRLVHGGPRRLIQTEGVGGLCHSWPTAGGRPGHASCVRGRATETASLSCVLNGKQAGRGRVFVFVEVCKYQ